ARDSERGGGRDRQAQRLNTLAPHQAAGVGWILPRHGSSLLLSPKGTAQANEAVKKCREEQKHFTQRRKVAEDAKKTKKLLFASLCALASLREIVYFFTASSAWVNMQINSHGALKGRFIGPPFQGLRGC